MKNKIQVFLLSFLLMISVLFIYRSFQLSSDKKNLQKELKETNQLYDENIAYNIRLEDSIRQIKNEMQKLKESDVFSLNGNPKAMDYFQKSFPDEDKDWEKFILDRLFKTNKKSKDNPIIPFAGMEGNMKIDRAKVLNNRWILAHFTDGKYQGEMIVRYDIGNNGKIDFKVLDQTLYP